jgi:hypothetical protein
LFFDACPTGDTLIKHQAIGSETLIPMNMTGSVIKFSGIAWVSRGHLNNGPELDITMSALPPIADILSAGIDVC